MSEPTASLIDGCCQPIFEPGLSDDDAGVLARTFGALADPVRLRILSCIAAQPSGECCGCDLTRPLDRSQPTISHHLKALAEVGLIRGEKRGRWVWYSIVPERVELLRTLLDTSCCPPLVKSGGRPAERR
jgi:ArsR family transcriptional regulator, arsenate/arsenite/antimonite-responsive transcriptional repressor